MFGKSRDDRRNEVRKPANRRAVLLGGSGEIACRITDESRSGLKLTLDRPADAS